MTRKIILAGNSITADILAGYLSADADHEPVAVCVDAAFVDSGTVENLPCVATSELQDRFDPIDHGIVMAMGYNDLNTVRERMFNTLRDAGFTIEKWIHPEAHVHDPDAIGEGSVVLPGAVIEPGASVGANTMIWSNVTIGHHAKVEDHCWIAAGTVIAGNARVGRNSFIGVNATVVNEKTVGEYNIVGAGALISRDTRDNSVHLARSAEPLRFSSQDYLKHFGV